MTQPPRQLSIPVGATVRVTRQDGSHDVYVFRGSDGNGLIYEDAQGGRHGDLGVFKEVAIKSGGGWQVL